MLFHGKNLRLSDFEVIKPIKAPHVLLVKIKGQRQGSQYCLKLHTSETDVQLHKEVFPKVRQSHFRRLVLPKHEGSGLILNNWGWWLLTEYIDGNTIAWDEFNKAHIGGKSFDQSYVTAYLELLQDLSDIDPSLVRKVFPSTNGYHSLGRLTDRVNTLLEFGLLRKKEHELLKGYLQANQGITNSSQVILSNGDLHARNLLAQPADKLALVDWTLSRGLGPVELSIAYQWILMWQNIRMQKLLARQGAEIFNISEDRFRYAVVVQSLQQAHTWRRHRPLAEIELQYALQGASSKDFLE